MILSHKELKEALKNGEIVVDPLIDEAIGPCSIDLTLNDNFTVFNCV
ncbi:MAG: dCTP deaminase domain-containing protein [Candidatus Hodarchaeales archaeon]